MNVRMSDQVLTFFHIQSFIWSCSVKYYVTVNKNICIKNPVITRLYCCIKALCFEYTWTLFLFPQIYHSLSPVIFCIDYMQVTDLAPAKHMRRTLEKSCTSFVNTYCCFEGISRLLKHSSIKLECKIFHLLHSEVDHYPIPQGAMIFLHRWHPDVTHCCVFACPVAS